jgi:hypothetical protein
VLRLVLCCKKVAHYTSGVLRALYTSFLCPLTANSHNAFLMINIDFLFALLFPYSDNQSAWTASKQIISLPTSSLSRLTVLFWYSSPDWLVSIGLLSSRPSTSLYHSTAFFYIVLKCPYPTGHNWYQLRDTSYCVDDSWYHSLSVFVESIAICVCFVLSHGWNHDNTQQWVVMMWSKNLCVVVIGVVIVLAYQWWTLSHPHCWNTDC